MTAIGDVTIRGGPTPEQAAAIAAAVARLLEEEKARATVRPRPASPSAWVAAAGLVPYEPPTRG